MRVWHDGVYITAFFFPLFSPLHYSSVITLLQLLSAPLSTHIRSRFQVKPLRNIWVPTNYFVFFGGGILRPKNQSGSFCLVNVGSGLHCHCSCAFPLGWTGWAYIQCSTSTSVSVYASLIGDCLIYHSWASSYFGESKKNRACISFWTCSSHQDTGYKHESCLLSHAAASTLKMCTRKHNLLTPCTACFDSVKMII